MGPGLSTSTPQAQGKTVEQPYEFKGKTKELTAGEEQMMSQSSTCAEKESQASNAEEMDAKMAVNKANEEAYMVEGCEMDELEAESQAALEEELGKALSEEYEDEDEETLRWMAEKIRGDRAKKEGWEAEGKR